LLRDYLYQKFEYLIVFHAILGGLIFLFPVLGTVYSILIFFVFLGLILNSPKPVAHHYAGYLVAAEILFRVSRSSIFYEFGKYSCIVVLLAGVIKSKIYKRKNFTFIFILFLFVPSLLISDLSTFSRHLDQISFYFSGILLLIISVAYFRSIALEPRDFQTLLRFMILPYISTVVYLFLSSSSIIDMEFTLGASAEASGGFGPNQVSTSLGLGAIVAFLLFRDKITIFNSKNFILIIIALIALRGLITFSRGGMLGAVGAFALVLFMGRSFTRKRKSQIKILPAILFVTVLGAITYYVNDQTGGLLSLRYQGETVDHFYYGTNKGPNMFTGRDIIWQQEWDIFLDNPILGAGVGMSSFIRSTDGFSSASHTEYSRLIAEHGMVGLLMNFLLIMLPVSRYLYFRKRKYRSDLLVAFAFLALFTMGHSAMRLSIPGFLFGLSQVVFLPTVAASIEPEPSESSEQVPITT
jgi:O-antigen ligase